MPLSRNTVLELELERGAPAIACVCFISTAVWMMITTTIIMTTLSFVTPCSLVSEEVLPPSHE